MTEHEILIKSLRLLREERARLRAQMEELPFSSRNYKEAAAVEEELTIFFSEVRLGLDSMAWMEAVR